MADDATRPLPTVAAVLGTFLSRQRYVRVLVTGAPGGKLAAVAVTSDNRHVCEGFTKNASEACVNKTCRWDTIL